MKDILLWDQRFPDRHPRRLSVDDTLASAMVRAGAAAPVNQADFSVLNAGGALSSATPTEIVVEDGVSKRTRRVVVPVSVAAIAVSLGVGASVSVPVTPSPTPTPAPTPSFSVAPSISPSSGTAGTTVFTGTDGTVLNGSVITREWLLNGSVVATGGVFAPNSSQAGTLTYRNTATGGAVTSTSTSVTIAATTAGKILMVSSFGNSRSIGRAPAQVGDIWPANCFEVKQGASVPVACTGTMLDVGDTSGNTEATMLSPWLGFAKFVNTQEPGVYDKIIFVADGQSATGVTDGVAATPAAGTWAGGVSGNRLDTHLSRWNTAYNAIVAANPGTTVDVLHHYYSANPDVAVDTGLLEPFMIGMRNAVRAAAGSATAPIIIGGGQTPDESTFGGENQTMNNALLATIGSSWDYADSYPVTTDKYSVGGTFPLATFDGTHLDYASEQIRCKLLYWSWKRALTRTDWKAVAQANYPAVANLVAQYNFNLGDRDIVSNDATKRLLRSNASYYPTVRGDLGAKRFVYQFPSAAAVNRVWTVPTTLAGPTGSYSKAMLIKQDALAAAMSFWSDTGPTVAAAQHRLQYSAASSIIQAGNGSAGTQASFPVADFALGVWHLLVVTYDATAGRLTLYLNGVQKAQVASGIAALDATARWGFIGGGASTGTAPARGMNCIFALAYNKELSSAEVASLVTLSNTFVTLGAA